MPLSNQQLATIFNDIADRLDIQGEIVFKVRAYRTVAENILNAPRPVSDLWQEGALDQIPGVGKEIAAKIDELMRTGRLEFYERLRSQVPDGVAAMLRVPNVGPKRVKEFWEKLGITSIDELEAAAKAGKLRDLPRMGEKAEQKILAGIESLKRRATGRMRLGDALPIAQRIVAALREAPGVQKAEYAGSLRRGKETIGDVDIIVAATDPAPAMQVFLAQPGIAEVLAAGETKSSVRLENGLQVDVRVVEPRVWGTALQYFTGSQLHNIKLRELAQKKGLTLNEYAVSKLGGRDSAESGETFADEPALYARLGLAYIPPELREDRGEVEKALELGPGRAVMPDLIALNDLKGDLQMHTTWSDGAADVMSMARAAIALGYEYILITDHTAGLGVVNGLTPERIVQQRKEIDKVNAQLKKEGVKFRVLQGAEVEVRSDGSLDLPDDALAQLDLVQASVHTALTQPREKITARAIKALQHPHVNILGHPSGRLINEREGADYDWEALFHAALENDVALEINADPSRLDLSDVLARRAVELGCKLSISTDAHSPDCLRHMVLGVTVARRAWVTPDSVINTWPLNKLLKWADKSRA
ncbi:MAG: DNA polymerase/3'-5' exonuclease PolX [Anaerolineae bacterium]|nr:DNA polymerase/3'-5' exonuclease PolX [Candidatus Roseilinea sp.]MDW8449483.1 DNA polymerase/3'-5' exonuclease PolX [Anaerolineae bacterium]